MNGASQKALVVKNPPVNARYVGSFSGVKKIPCSRKWQLTPVFLPENPMDSGTWRATVHRAAKSWIQLSDREYTEIQENEQFRGMVIRDPSQVYLS